MMKLHIPEGINYECTGCGTCCGGWAVPMTAEDYARISAIDWKSLSPKFQGKRLFRSLTNNEKKLTPYTHAIIPAADGHCPFLDDKLCFIHKSFQAETKPSICQLFPYCFNETPSGIYATVSFNSMGVIYNSGKALSDQKDWLEKKWGEFQKLFPDHHPNWSSIKLTVGSLLTWEDYLKHEEKLLEYLQDRKLTLEERFLKGSYYLTANLKPTGNRSSETITLNHLDKQLLAALHKLYFPADNSSHGGKSFDLIKFALQTFFPCNNLHTKSNSYSFETLFKFPWTQEDKDIDDLIYRYFYSHIFGKNYFGAGFGQLSLIAGFHHLAITYALIKLQSKASALDRLAPKVSLIDVIATIRQLEKSLGETSLTGYAAAIWELLMFSPKRIQRILAM